MLEYDRCELCAGLAETRNRQVAFRLHCWQVARAGLTMTQCLSMKIVQSGFCTFAKGSKAVAEATWSANIACHGYYPRQGVRLQHTVRKPVSINNTDCCTQQ